MPFSSKEDGLHWVMFKIPLPLQDKPSSFSITLYRKNIKQPLPSTMDGKESCKSEAIRTFNWNKLSHILTHSSETAPFWKCLKHHVNVLLPGHTCLPAILEGKEKQMKPVENQKNKRCFGWAGKAKQKVTLSKDEKTYDIMNFFAS